MWKANLWNQTRWLGVPVQQWPTDLVVLQDLIYSTKPNYIIETGTALGGSALFYASIFELMGQGSVVSIDIDQTHSERTLKGHPLSHRIKLIQGDSKSPEVRERVKDIVGRQPHLHVFLDSNHTADHVLNELENFKTLVPVGDYLVAFDTNTADAREWKGSNPLIAVERFLAKNPEFAQDHQWEKFRVTFIRNGFLKRVKA
jgi:cephalosporin hydroxylase